MNYEGRLKNDMKKLAVIVILLMVGVAYGEEGKCPVPWKDMNVTGISDCMTCHIAGDFRVIETAADAHLVYPNRHMQMYEGKGYFLMDDILDDELKEFFDYLHRRNVTEAIIEIHSPGGALFDAQRIVSIIRYWQKRGITVETWLRGMAFSAGFYIFTAGDNRLVDEFSDLMWHELQAASFGFNVTTPADREEEARILRHIQDIRSRYLATRGDMTKDEIDAKIERKEWWMSGKDAVEYGFADGYL